MNNIIASFIVWQTYLRSSWCENLKTIGTGVSKKFSSSALKTRYINKIAFKTLAADYTKLKHTYKYAHNFETV